VCNGIDDNCNTQTDEAIKTYNYVDNTSGAPLSVSPNATATSLSRVNGAGSSTACTTGFTSKSFPATTTFNTTLPAIEFTITPSSGYQLQAASISAGMRRSNTGPASVRMAYSLNGGSTWIDEGTNHTLSSSTCGVMTTITWDFSDFASVQQVKFRIYGFNASATSGVFQLMNVNLNGKVCPVTDADGDGFTASVDCNDNNPAVHPGATEVCNGIDDNCDTQIDEGVKSTFYADSDNDTYGNPSVTTLACSAPTGFVSNNTDCNDGNTNIHPGATEVCNGIDDNCNTQTDEGVKTTFYADSDNDTYGNLSVTTLAC